MATAIQAEPVPIKADDNGVLRVGDTRVLLDLPVHAFNAIYSGGNRPCL